MTDEACRSRIRSDARENRRRLLATAKDLFAAQGSEATSMQEIARVAGVGQGTLYRHFADKAAICQALIEADIAAFQERVGPVLSGGWVLASPLARLELLLVEKIRLTESHLPLFAALEQSPPGKRGVKPFQGPFYLWQREQIVALLSEASAQGEVDGIDVEFMADAVLAVTSPRLYSHQHDELGYSSERVIAGLRRLFIDAMREA